MQENAGSCEASESVRWNPDADDEEDKAMTVWRSRFDLKICLKTSQAGLRDPSRFTIIYEQSKTATQVMRASKHHESQRLLASQHSNRKAFHRE